MSEKKTRVRQVFGRQKLQAADKTFVFEMSKSGVSVCATGRGQLESSKTFPELLAFIAGIELLPCVAVELDTKEKIEAAILDATQARADIAAKIATLELQSSNLLEKLRGLGQRLAEKQTLQLL